MNRKYIVMQVMIVWLSSLLITFCTENKKDSNVQKSSPVVELNQGEVVFYRADSSKISTVIVEIASDDYSRVKGLMFRDNLPENQGMLFIFEEEREQAFWMKNTPVSLDIMYLNSGFEIVSIAKYTKPFSMRSIPSHKPAKYVVEVVAGYCDQYDINAGDHITFKKY